MSESIHHWVGLEPDVYKYFGFCYRITNKTNNRLYIGKKQFWQKKKTPKTTCTDISNPKWKQAAWRQSDWRFYKSSCVSLKEDILRDGEENFIFEIISLHESKGTLHYGEIEWQVLLNVLKEKDGEGIKVYYNACISGIRFIPRDECSPRLKELMLSDLNPVRRGLDWKHNKTPEEIEGINRRRSINSPKPMKGKKHTPETREKLSVKAKKRTPEQNPMWGRKHTDSTKAKIGLKSKERCLKTHNPRTDLTVYIFRHDSGIEFIGIRKDFQGKYNIHSSITSRLVNGKLKKAKGWVVVKKSEDTPC